MKSWAYGVTTVPERLNSLLPRTLLSLHTAGFSNPTLFIDGESDTSKYQQFGLSFTSHYRNPQGCIKTFANWFSALHLLYLQNPRADLYAIFQDDFVMCKGVREYLDSCEYPTRGYWNLYTMPSNQEIADKGNLKGWFKSNQFGRSAIGLVFDLDTVIRLLTSELMLTKHTLPKPYHCVDGTVSHALNEIGWTEYCHNPSLTQHTGTKTTMGSAVQPLAPSFKGENWDVREELSCV